MNHEIGGPLSASEHRGLVQLGDAYFPRVAELPSFSECGCAEHADAAFQYLPADDRRNLKRVLALVGLSPPCVARGLVALMERGITLPGPVGTVLRLLRLGIKGIVASLYYSGEVGRNYQGPSPLEVLQYQVTVYTDDVAARATGSVAACAGLLPTDRDAQPAGDHDDAREVT